MIKLDHHNETMRRFDDEWLTLSKETLICSLSDEEKEQLKQQILNRMQMRNFPDVADLAANDGLSLADWKEWFKNYDLTQPLAVIQFTPFKYQKRF